MGIRIEMVGVPNPRSEAFALVERERKRQIDQWGARPGYHPFEWMSILAEEVGALTEAVNDKPERGGAEKIIREAIQVAAVALAIAENTIAGAREGMDVSTLG
jgi:hypothetical protein